MVVLANAKPPSQTVLTVVLMPSSSVTTSGERRSRTPDLDVSVGDFHPLTAAPLNAMVPPSLSNDVTLSVHCPSVTVFADEEYVQVVAEAVAAANAVAAARAAAMILVFMILILS